MKSPAGVLEKTVLDEREKKLVREGAVHKLKLLIMGNRFLIGGNTPGPLEDFLSIYGRLKVEHFGEGGPDVSIHYREEKDEAGWTATFLVNGEPSRIRGEDAAGLVMNTLIYLIYTNISSHWIIHGGCVSINGRGIIISGDSGMGKSTLTTHLVARGMEYLSDELAPINRKTGHVDSVPLSIGIRPGPAEKLVEGKPFVDYNFLDDQKKLVDAGHLTGRKAGGPVPLRAVIFLTSNPAGDVATPGKFDRTVRITLTGTSGAFEEDLFACGIRVTGRGSVGPLPVLELAVDDPPGFLPVIYRLTGKHGLGLASMQYENLDDPDFSKKAELVGIPAAAGIIELSKKIIGHHKSAVIKKEYKNSAAMMVRDLAARLGHVSFYKLKPGRLDEMLSLIEGLMT